MGFQDLKEEGCRFLEIRKSQVCLGSKRVQEEGCGGIGRAKLGGFEGRVETDAQSVSGTLGNGLGGLGTGEGTGADGS